MTTEFHVVAIFDNRGAMSIEAFYSFEHAIAWRDGFRRAVQLYDGHIRAYALFDQNNVLEMEKTEPADQIAKVVAMVDAAQKRAQEKK